jgi:inosine/xanthosine triphosphate pyrophosphatase family protein
VFFDREMNCTAAELDGVTKNARSHRGKALLALKGKLVGGC